MFKRVSKRKKFIISSLILFLGLLGVGFFNITWKWQAIVLLMVLSYFLSAWSLLEGLVGIEWFMVLVLPVLFTGGMGFFTLFIFLPIIYKIFTAVLYAVGIYILLLVGNIFSVAAMRTIQLLRSARVVGFLLTLVTAFFIYDIVFLFRLPFWENFLLVSIISFPLILQGLWSVNLEERISSTLFLYSLILSLIQGEIAIAFSFWPVSVAVGSLALSTMLYITLGLGQYQLAQRLFNKTMREYFGVGIIVLLVIFLTTRWGG